MRKLFLIFTTLFTLVGCSLKDDAKPTIADSLDIIEVSQNVSRYTSLIDDKNISTLEQFENNYFRVWNIKKISTSLEDARWAYTIYTPLNSYGENLQTIKQDFFDIIEDNSNFSEYATYNKRAVSLKELNIRTFPTNRPLFLDPDIAGEGFPFDYLQNSTISANKPLFISHYSKDKEWAFVECSFTFGWVETRDIALLSKKYTDRWQKAKQVFITKDGYAIRDKRDNFLFNSKIGMMLPLISEDENSYSVLAISNYKGSEALYREVNLPKSVAHEDILDFNSQNINNIISQLLKSNYGWGGMYSQRDCSSTIRDFFAPFGIWLPRNSSKQAEFGEIISLDAMNNEEKINIIKKHAKPFRTLLYKQGHIVLYVGEVDGEIIVFHNTWGIKTKEKLEEGRFIIGRTLFSTLFLGKKHAKHDPDALIIEKLKSLSKL
ncbi:glycoside hydrolase [Sulfurimonas aquatica]|uniref:Glycoside hydrolase n=1 Tax=Sulfurimonas aquatica TaxID=2672570 RepID=A0A975B014_9BACT|nr:SH3 domain-containing C40 family peptidase [Sulfurimonas aquatica]QSZ41734.1 glycoside hydrolase [Sulfurimonas aquatica]